MLFSSMIAIANKIEFHLLPLRFNGHSEQIAHQLNKVTVHNGLN